MLLVYLLVDGTCGDPSIIALLGSDGAQKYISVPAKRNPFQDFYSGNWISTTSRDAGRTCGNIL